MRGTAINPGLALGSRAAFKKMDKEAMVMGDLVLTGQEIEPVMRNLQEGGIEIAAVHNHHIGEQPRILYRHIASRGDAVKMAAAIHDALALSKTPGPDTSGPAAGNELSTAGAWDRGDGSAQSHVDRRASSLSLCICGQTTMWPSSCRGCELRSISRIPRSSDCGSFKSDGV